MGKDFLDVPMDSGKCMACQICGQHYQPPGGGILYANDFFFVHQDPLVAIPGFLIVSPRRHIYAVDEMTPLELRALGPTVAMAEKAVRATTDVAYITILQEEKVTEGHLHIWIFPWHDFILQTYPHSLKKIRVITEHYKQDMQYLEETLAAAEKAGEFFRAQEAYDRELDFQGQFLCNQDFSGRDLSHANFRGTILKRCKFNRCDLSHANFDDADLYRATFHDSKLYSATFKNADLTRAEFTGARLYGIKIFGADLSHTIFDSTVPEEKEQKYAQAEDIYNTIKRAYSENGNKEEAARYYYKQCVAKRKQQKGPIRLLNWLVADLLIGYGERLSRCLTLCALVIIGFAGLYFVRNGMADLSHCLITSLALFFGFDPVGTPALLTELNVWFTAEQLVGYFFIALALIGLTRKIVRD